MNPSNPLTLKRTLIVLALVVLCATIIPPLTTLAAPPAQGNVYYVQYGDTLFSISRRFNTTVPAIMAANNLTSEFIYAGQRLVIPTGGTTGTVTPGTPTATVTGTITPGSVTPGPFSCKYTVQYRDTLYSIAWRYKTTVGALMQANYLYYPLIYVNQQLTVPCVTPDPGPFRTHTVQAGENLFRIAIQYSTSIRALAIVNGIYNPNLIYAGQTLVIPYEGSKVWPTGIPAVTPNPNTTGTPTPTPTITTTPGGNGGNVCPANTCPVIIRNLAFEPPTMTINRGTTVTWLNLDTVNHTLVSGVPGTPSNVFTSPAIGPNQNYSFTFPNPGTFKYFDQDQGANLTGTIVVQ